MSRPPRVFISRATAGLAALAEQVAEALRQRGIEPIIQTGFYPSTHDVKGMLAEHLLQCDAVICLILTAKDGSAAPLYGSGPHDPITKAEQPVHGLRDPRTKDRLFSYTQLELLIARDLGRPIYTFFIEGAELPTAFAPEPPELAQRQQTFITEFAKDGRNTYGTFSQWDQPADPARGLKQAIEAIQFEITVLAGKPTNLPYTSLGTLFKGRGEFLAELRQHPHRRRPRRHQRQAHHPRHGWRRQDPRRHRIRLETRQRLPRPPLHLRRHRSRTVHINLAICSLKLQAVRYEFFGTTPSISHFHQPGDR